MLLENKDDKQYSDDELSAMRKEVLRWVDKMERKADRKPIFSFRRPKLAPKVPPVKKLKFVTDKNIQLKIKSRDKIKSPQKILSFNIFCTPSLKKVLLSLIVSFFILIIFIGWGIYYQGWQGAFVSLIAKTIPIPAMSVNGQLVSYADYMFNYETFSKIAERNKVENIDDAELKKSAREKITSDVVIAELSQQNNVSISGQELNKAFDSLLQQSGSKENFEKTVLEPYGWSYNEFKQKVLIPNIRTKKLATTLYNSDFLQQIMEKKLAAILQQINDGKITFEQAAASYSHDITSTVNGSMGYVVRGQLSPEAENIIFNMQAGEISGIIKLVSGYYIYKVEDKIESKPQDSKNELLEKTRVVSVNLKQIYISPEKSLQELINEKIEQADVKVFVKN